MSIHSGSPVTAPPPHGGKETWCAIEPRLADVAHFQDGTLVLNGLSWETHLLNPEAVAILDLLRARARGESELLQALVADHSLDEADRSYYAVKLRTGLQELEALGLVRPANDQDR